MDLFEIVIVLAIALVVLGPERLPEVLRTVGKILRELRAASNTVMRELSDVLEEQPARAESCGSSAARGSCAREPARGSATDGRRIASAGTLCGACRRRYRGKARSAGA